MIAKPSPMSAALSEMTTKAAREAAARHAEAEADAKIARAIQKREARDGG